MCGLVERFNPAVVGLRNYALSARSATARCASAQPPLVVHSSVVNDVMLHDLDLGADAYGRGDAVVEVVAHAGGLAGRLAETVTCSLTSRAA